MSAPRGDELLRGLARDATTRESSVAWSRLASALSRAGRPAEAFEAASHALELDPDDPARELLVSGWSGKTVPWNLGHIGRPRRLGVHVVPAPSFSLHDLGRGILCVAHHPTTRPQEAPYAHEPLELIAIDLLGERILWRREFERITHDKVEATNEGIFAIREGADPWHHEIVLIDGRSGEERAARSLKFDRRIRKPVRASRNEAWHWQDRHGSLETAICLSTERTGSVRATIAARRLPEALEAPPFDLACVLVPEVLAPRSTPRGRLWSHGDVRGWTLVCHGDNTGCYGHEIGRPGQRWHVGMDHVPLTSTSRGFLFRMQFVQGEGQLRLLDAATGVRLASALLPLEEGEWIVQVTSVDDTIILRTALRPISRPGNARARWRDMSRDTRRRWEAARARLFALDASSLDIRWVTSAGVSFFATSRELLCPEPARAGRRPLVVRDLATGVEVQRLSYPWREHPTRGAPAAEWERLLQTRGQYGSVPDRSYCGLFAGRFLVSSAAGTFVFQRR